MGILLRRIHGLACCAALVAAGWGALGGAAGMAAAATRGHVQPLSPWDHAVRSRLLFEAQPHGTHTRAEYARVLDEFRAIYHDDPAEPHAARAVAQVAELLAEQGREFTDRKSLHDAAGQWEFLAKAYPQGPLAPEALGQALDLLRPEGADDPAELRRVRAAGLLSPQRCRQGCS
jgi:N-acetylmuramoyl-L-alanine amidase